MKAFNIVVVSNKNKKSAQKEGVDKGDDQDQSFPFDIKQNDEQNLLIVDSTDTDGLKPEEEESGGDEGEELMHDKDDYYELEEQEEGVRPKTFDEIIGRGQEKEMLVMMIGAARKRGDVIDHILFYGPPGLGKTTFAVSIANEVGSSMKITSGPAIERQGDLAAILTNLRKDDILFIDEIHRLNRTIEEVLYPAMEDGVIDIVMGKGPSAKTIRLNLESFTLIGATTQIGKISSPMRERFGLIQRLDYFSDEDLAQIIKRAAKIEGIEIDDKSTEEIAKRSRGTGRVTLRLFRRVRDFHQATGKAGKDVIDMEDVDGAFKLLGVDEYGLTDIDRQLLWVLYHNFGGGPVGLSTLGAAISEDLSTISDVYEPFLLKQGLIQRTSRGRVLTQKGLVYVDDLDLEFGGKF